MNETDHLRLPYIMAAQAQKHVTHNEALRTLDAVVQLSVLDRDLTAAPASPADGDRYIVASGATGDWAGHDLELAAYQDGAWMFHAPKAGWIAWIEDETGAVVWNGSAWAAFGGGGGGSSPPATHSADGLMLAADKIRHDALLPLNILDKDLATPPGAPNSGDTYIVAASATGDWAGQDGNIASYLSAAWRFVSATEGMIAWVADEDRLYRYDGAAWADALQNLSWLGINAAADATNKLAVKSAASLFDNVGNGHQVKVNKAAAADTASFLFQTAFSGRAEMGTAGDDDFHFKVSPDGSTFHESFVLDKDNGDAAFKQNTSHDGFFDISEIAVPANPAADTARLYAKDDGGTTKLAMKDSAGTETVFGSGGGGGGGASLEHLIVVDEKTAGTHGGTFSSGSWVKRDLNTIRWNNISGASISSSVITLPAGDYIARWCAPAYDVNYHLTRLRNTTDGISYTGQTAYSGSGDAVSNNSPGVAYFSIGASKNFELQHQCSTSKSSHGLGLNSDFGEPPVYAMIEFQKVG